MENDVRYNMTDLEADLKIAQARIKELETKTAGMVEVPCRCRDCTHNKTEFALRDGGIWCNYWGIYLDPDGWCYKGERRNKDG